MKAAKFMVTRAALVAGLIVLASGSQARADSLSIDFENPPYTATSINGQDGWSATGAYDYGVVATSSFGSPAGFAAQAFRISNAITSGSFADWAFSKSLTDEAGEPGAANGGYSGGGASAALRGVVRHRGGRSERAARTADLGLARPGATGHG